ncbi:unknown protein [Desulfotalea psychrophila LSv54]|uniref:Uncharacterized protein n=2 Tax=Desulfotalea psychrophila TaxID=84980 RepID=Q6AN49_DESPS|nr:unknown protein [Desulfotalea psychrophila LSv54]
MTGMMQDSCRQTILSCIYLEIFKKKSEIMDFSFEEAAPIEIRRMEGIEDYFQERVKDMVVQALETGNTTYQLEVDDKEHLPYLREQFELLFRLSHSIDKRDGSIDSYRVFAAKQDEDMGVSFTLSARFIALLKTEPKILDLF